MEKLPLHYKNQTQRTKFIILTQVSMLNFIGWNLEAQNTMKKHKYSRTSMGEHLWNHEYVFETGLVQSDEC